MSDKTIRLNSQVRNEITRRIMDAWEAVNKPEPFSGLASPAQLKGMERFKRDKFDYRHNLQLALGTFKTVAELVEEWPEIEKYVPKVLLDPRGQVELP